MRLALLIFAGVTLATHHLRYLRPLKQRNEYVFRFEGEAHSGVPLPVNTTVSHIRAVVHVQILDDHRAILKLKDARFAAGEVYHRSLIKPMDELKVHTISEEHTMILELPVLFIYENGMVSGLVLSDGEQTWSANVKRSIINMLQLNLHKIGRTHGSFATDRDSHNFTVLERTIEGDCEVAYTVLKKNDSVAEISKSVNFDKCTGRPEAKYNFRYVTECPGCKGNDFLEPSTVYSYSLKEDELKKVEVSSTYLITDKDLPVMKTEIHTKLILEDVKEIGRELERIDGKKQTLIFSDEIDKQIEHFYMYGDDGKVQPYEPVNDKIKEVGTIIDEMKELEENGREATHLLSRLVIMFRMFTLEELSIVQSRYYDNCDKRLRSMIEHSLAIAGTANAVTYLLRMTNEEEFETYKLMHLLKIIQETPYPSRKIVDELLHFAMTDAVESSPVIRQTIWLAIGTLMRAVVGKTGDKILLKEDHRELKQRYLNIMMAQFEKADTIYEKVLALKSLANAGLDISVYELEKIILDKRGELPVRIEAVDALRLLRNSPHKIQSILMPVYKSRAEDPELRMVALLRIMETLPRQPLIIQIISAMQREPNLEVAAFTADMLNTFAESTHICYRNLTSVIFPLFSKSRCQRRERVLASTYKHLPLFIEKIVTGININFATIFGKSSFWPKEVMVRLDSVFSGMWNKYSSQLGVIQQNIGKFIHNLTHQLMKMEKNQNKVMCGHHICSLLPLLEGAGKNLGIISSPVDDKTPYAMLYLRYKDMDYAVLPIDEKIVDELLEKFIREGQLGEREINRLFKRDSEFKLYSFAFLHETIRKIPTPLGVPLIVKYKLPTVLSAEGEFGLKIVPHGLRLRLNTVPSAASTELFEMRLWNPLFEQGVRIARSIEAHLPIDFDMVITYRNGLEVKKTFGIPTKEKTIARFTSRPMTFFRFLSGQESFGKTEIRTVVLPEWRQISKQKELVYSIWGLKMVFRGNWLREWNMSNVLLGQHDWELCIIPTHDAPKKIRLFLNSRGIENISLDTNNFTPQSEKVFEAKIDKLENLADGRHREQFHRFVRDIEMEDGYRNRLILGIESVNSMVDYYGNVEITSVCDVGLRYCKNTVEGKRSPTDGERSEWNIMMDTEFVFPKRPTSLEELRKQIHLDVQGLLVMKWGADETNELIMKIQLGQSRGQKKLSEIVDKKLEGLAAYDLFLKASRLNQLKVVVDYHLTPYIKSLFELTYNYIRSSTTCTAKVRNFNNKLLLNVQVDPVTSNLVNVVFDTPYERMKLVDVVVPRLYLPTIAKRTLRDIHYELNEPVCEVKSAKVQTFEDITFRIPLTTCYSVVAKECSKDPRYTVMIKNIETDSDVKKLKIINEHGQVIIVEMVDDRPVAFVNGRRVYEEVMEKYNIEPVGISMVRVRLLDLMVHFDGYTARIYMSKHMIEDQCGLCGRSDDEKASEVPSPTKEYIDIMNFNQSCLLKGECGVEENYSREKKHYRLKEHEDSEETIEDWPDIQEDDRNHRDNKRLHRNRFEGKSEGKEEVYPIHQDATQKRVEEDEENAAILERTHVIEAAHGVCFSLEPVPVCRKNEQMSTVINREVSFTCLPRSSSEARHLLREARSNTLDLKHYPISFVKSIKVPLTCTTVY
uniref:Vitellogenin domain-containing protein n=1 Tax=Haemonchus contortus TaxID=6289 RepID=A0A7I4Z585_HAECO